MVAAGVNTGAVPEATRVPPHEPVYQFHVPAVPKVPPVLPRVVLLPKHIGVIAVPAVAGVDVG